MPTVYATVPRSEADELAQSLVEAKLVACVNRFDCQSVYRWDGEVHDDPETILLAKTSEDCVEAAVQRLEEIHPYEVPCIEVFEEADAIEPFMQWINTVTTPTNSTSDSTDTGT